MHIKEQSRVTLSLSSVQSCLGQWRNVNIQLKVLLGYSFALVCGNELEVNYCLSASKFTQLTGKNRSWWKDKCENRRTVFGGRCISCGCTCRKLLLQFQITCSWQCTRTMSFEIVTKFKFCKASSWMPLLLNYACLCLAAANLLLRLLLDSFGRVFAVVHTMRSCSKGQLQYLKSTHTHRHQCHAKICCKFW